MASLEKLTQNEPRVVGDDRGGGRGTAYTLVGRIRAGRLGNVYLARRADGERVEITLVDERLAWDASMLSTLADDVDDLRRIRRHALVARPLDADLRSRHPWIATRFVPGPTLRAVVRDHGPVGDEASEALLARLAETVRHLHSEGQIHRGLEPDTVVLTAHGPVITGLGAARALSSFESTIPVRHDDATAYRPSEVIRGLETGIPGDVFGLGASVVLATTGRGPFGTGSSTEVMRRVIDGEPDLRGVPEPLATILAACLRPEPGRRPSPAQILARLPQETTGTYPPRIMDSIRAWERLGRGRAAGHRDRAAPFAPPSTEDLEPTLPGGDRRPAPRDVRARSGDTAPLDPLDTDRTAPDAVPVMPDAVEPDHAAPDHAVPDDAVSDATTVAGPAGSAPERAPDSVPVRLPPPVAPGPPPSIAPSRSGTGHGPGRRALIVAAVLVAAATLGAALAVLLVR